MTKRRLLRDIIHELRLDIMRRNPAICDWSPMSINLTLAQAYSKQIYDLEGLVQETAENLFVLTAKGVALDKLVVDRLPEGRLPGTLATGFIAFARSFSLPIDVLIPTGSIVSQPNENAVAVYFETIEDATLKAGEMSVEAPARAMVAGIGGNAPANTITGRVSTPSGIQFVSNPLPFIGGTDAESDEDLKKRYIYAVQIPGRATESMILQHLLELAVVTDSKVFTVAPGVVEILTTIHPTETEKNYDAIYKNIEKIIVTNIAAGIVAHGLVGARIKEGEFETGIASGAGAPVFCVVDSFPTGKEEIEFTYTNKDKLKDQIGTITIPIHSPVGTAIRAVLKGSDKCVRINDITKYQSETGESPKGSYTLTMGEGKYPYLFNEPVMVPINVDVAVRATESADKKGVKADIIDSVTAALDQYKIGDDVEFSDVVKHVYDDSRTSKTIMDIDEITQMSLSATIDGQEFSASGFGQKIVIQNQQCAKAGGIKVEVVGTKRSILPFEDQPN